MTPRRPGPASCDCTEIYQSVPDANPERLSGACAKEQVGVAYAANARNHGQILEASSAVAVRFVIFFTTPHARENASDDPPHATSRAVSRESRLRWWQTHSARGRCYEKLPRGSAS